MKRSIRQAGFSLIEIIVVVALVGLIAAIGYPMLSHTVQRYRVSTPVSQIQQILTQARARAIRQNFVVGVNIDPNGGGPGMTRVQMFRDLNNDDKFNAGLAAPNTEELTGPSTMFDFTGWIALRYFDNSTSAAGVALTFPSNAANQIVAGPDHRIFFYPNGTVSSSSQSFIPLPVLPSPSQTNPLFATSRGEIYISNFNAGFGNDSTGLPKNTFRIAIEAPLTGRITTVKYAHPPDLATASFIRPPYHWYY